VQTFIVTHDARAQVVKARENRKQDDRRENDDFICDRRQSRVDGTFEPVLFVVIILFFDV